MASVKVASDLQEEIVNKYRSLSTTSSSNVRVERMSIALPFNTGDNGFNSFCTVRTEKILPVGQKKEPDTCMYG